MGKWFGAGAVVMLLSGCVTMSGTYVITATRFDRTPMDNVRMVAQGRGIYTVKNAICASNPGATIVIKDVQSGQELKSESPHQCRGKTFADTSLQAANQKLEAQFSPFRLVPQTTGDQASKATAEWAGTPGASITANSAEVRVDVFRSFKDKCGFEAAQLAETRVVKYALPVFHEVWVFDDPQSEREDKKSGLSLVLKQLPNNGGVDFVVYGECHSKKLPVFHFIK